MPSRRPPPEKSRCTGSSQPSEHESFIRQRRQKLRIRRLVKDFVVEGSLIGLSTISGRTLSTYDPQHNQRPRRLAMNQAFPSIRTQLPTLLASLDRISKATEKVQENIMKQITQHNSLEAIATKLSSLLSKPLSHLLNDPPPLLFLAALIIFILSLTSLRNYRKNDRYQDRILGTGAAIGITAAIWSNDVVMNLKSYLVRSIILAVVFSSVAHRLMSLWPDPNLRIGEIRLEKEGGDEKLDTGQL